MAKNTQQKKQLIDKYVDQIKKAAGIYFFAGNLNAKQTQEIKNKVTEDAKLSLLKNTLFNKAAKESGLDIEVTGYNNVIFVENNLIENASQLNKLASDNEYKMTNVVVGKNSYDGAKLKEIANLGSESQVYGKLVGMLATPTTMVVRSLQSPMQKLVYVLSQIKQS